MDQTQFCGDQRSVSSVISVILLVAVTVILASVVSVFALDIAEETQKTAPSGSFDFNYISESGNIEVTYANGDEIDGNQLRFAGAALEKNSYGGISEWAGGPVVAGDTATVNAVAGEELRVTWQNDQGTDSAVLGTYDVPDVASASGSISDVSVDTGDDEVAVTISSLSNVDANSAHAVVEVDGTEQASGDISSASQRTFNIPVDAGDSVTVTLYESSSANNQIGSSVTETAPDITADIGRINADDVSRQSANPDGEVDVTIASMNNVANDNVYVVVKNTEGGNNPSDSGTISAGQVNTPVTFTLDSDNVANGQEILVTVYNTQNGEQLDQESVDAGQDQSV